MNLISLNPAPDRGGFVGIVSNETLRSGVPLLVELEAATHATPFWLPGLLP